MTVVNTKLDIYKTLFFQVYPKGLLSIVHTYIYKEVNIRMLNIVKKISHKKYRFASIKKYCNMLIFGISY